MIDLKDVNKYYKTGEESLHVLQDVNLTIDKGEFVAIMGPSGSGKSTLINLIGFIDRKFDGSYLFEGETMEKVSDKELSSLRNKNVGFVFQNFQLIENNTVYENIELPLLYGGKNFSQTSERVLEVAERVGLADKVKKHPKQLSGGQQQRVAIARAIVNDPKFIIADEPTGALDSHTSKEIMEVFQKLNKEGATIILVTHDPDTIKYCNRLIRIIDGKIIGDEVVAK
ncbi:MAG: ABC transporter ATP-binding protein [Lactobacillales bacterium]|jgi:putative ABC transport system ATP-binding protein|nr:ABC transporter ATP-binding protein [Lactobacillales bacterium]